MIRFLVDTTSSLTDTNGNRYHFATVTSTKSGKSLRVLSVGGDSNARALVSKHTGADWSEIHSTQCDMKIRDFQRARNFHDDGSGKYEHQFTAEDFTTLETPDV